MKEPTKADEPTGYIESGPTITTNTTSACQNTDRELWRERADDYYADSIHVTESGSISIDCGGHVITKTLRAWHALAVKDLPKPEPR